MWKRLAAKLPRVPSLTQRGRRVPTGLGPRGKLVFNSVHPVPAMCLAHRSRGMSDSLPCVDFMPPPHLLLSIDGDTNENKGSLQ